MSGSLKLGSAARLPFSRCTRGCIDQRSAPESPSESSSASNSPSLTRRSFEARQTKSASFASRGSCGDPMSDLDSERKDTAMGSSRSSTGGLKQSLSQLAGILSGTAGSAKSSAKSSKSFFNSSESRTDTRQRDTEQVMRVMMSNGAAASKKSSARTIDDSEHSSARENASKGTSKAANAARTSRTSSCEGSECSEESSKLSSSRSAEHIERACSKYGMSTGTIEDILAGKTAAKKHAQAKLRGYARSDFSDTSSDGIREEMLIYLLKEQLKLKAKLKGMRGHVKREAAPAEKTRKTNTSRRNNAAEMDDRHFKALDDLTHEEMRYLNKMCREAPIGDNDGIFPVDGLLENMRNGTMVPELLEHIDVEEALESTSPELSPALEMVNPVAALSHSMSRMERESTKRQGDQTPVDVLISKEANSLHNEIDQLIDNLENAGLGSMDPRARARPFVAEATTVARISHGGEHAPFRAVEGSDDEVDQDDCLFENGAERVMPVKVPIKPPMRERCDAQVLTDETAREHQLSTYERFNAEMDRISMESANAHQTDNTRIRKDGMAWEITESYLKEEERKMLQEKKRAELLKQLKDGTPVKSVTLQDHYNNWVAQKNAPRRAKDTINNVEQVGTEQKQNATEPSVQANGSSKLNTGECTPTVDATCAAMHRNVFRRTNGNSKGSARSNSASDEAMSQRSMHDETIGNQQVTDSADAQRDGDVFIKGSWDPRTGAVRISNEIDMTHIADNTTMLDQYVNFLKQNPGNWSQEHSHNGARDSNRRDAETQLRIDEHALLNNTRGDGPTANAKLYARTRSDATESPFSSPRGSIRMSRTPSDSPRKMYERDEFYPPNRQMPMESEGQQDGDPLMQRFNMGFRDTYMPAVRTAADLYSSSLAHLSMINGARQQAIVKAEETTQVQHHHHYYCSEKRNHKCQHRSSRHSCRHGHKHKCSKKKNADAGHQHVTETITVEHKPTVDFAKQATVSAFETSIIPRKVKSSQDMDGISCCMTRQDSPTFIALPSFGDMDNVRRAHTLPAGSLQEIGSPVSLSDIITSIPKAKSTDFVKVTTFHAPLTVTEDAVETPTIAPKTEKTSRGFLGCCSASTAVDAADTEQEAAVETPVAKATSLKESSSLLLESVSSNAAEELDAPVGESSPLRSASPGRVPHVFGRRAHSREGTPKTCISPLAKIEQIEGCSNMCQREFDSGVESGEQFTFRDMGHESPQANNLQPMIKTRLVYVG